MAELDIEALKRVMSGLIKRGDRVAVFTRDELAWLIATLEDRDRLRTQLNTCNAWLKYDIDGLGTPEEACAERDAALEDREQLRAQVAEWRELAESWVDYPQLPYSLEQEFRATLEGRDG